MVDEFLDVRVAVGVEICRCIARVVWGKAVPGFPLVGHAITVGVPVGLVGLFLYGLLYVLSSVFAGLVIGSLLLKVLFKRPAPLANWKAALLGVTVYTVAGLIPLVGWLFKLVFFLTAFGVISRKVYAAVWAER